MGGENQDTTIGNGSSDTMAPASALAEPMDLVAQTATETHRAVGSGSTNGDTSESSAASTSQSATALPVETAKPLSNGLPPPPTEEQMRLVNENYIESVRKNTLASKSTATETLSLAIDVPELLPVKRKSPRADSVNGSESLSKGKKQKIDSNNTTMDSSAPKPPIPSFSTPPGQKVNESVTASSKTNATTTTTKAPVAESNGDVKNSKNDFLTIKVGSTESEIVDATNDKTMEEKKEAQPPTTASSAAPDNNSALGIVSQYTTLAPLKEDIRPLRSLTTSERIQLERLFEFDHRKEDGKTWDDDWFGVLDLCHAEVYNPDNQGERNKKRSLLEWVGMNTNTTGSKKKTSKTNNSLNLLNNLLRHVYNYKNVPEQAKLILANIDPKEPTSIGNAIERLSIDPAVLQQDGWTTTKSKEPQGASGGPYRIGEKIWWQGYLGIVIAFVHDDDMGDLWKALWVEDMATFDLEREELEDSRKKYERKKAVNTEKKKKQEIHKTLQYDFSVAGIEHGIVLATSYARGAGHGVFWPARVLHASELVGKTGRRSKNKKKVDVAFLAPYWNGDQTLATNGTRRIEPFSGVIAMHGESIFSSGPMVEVESIDANDSCIQSYPYDAEIGLDIDSLRTTFKFLGLPKAAFSRFLDSQRLALGFKTYSQKEMKSTLASESDRTSAALLEGHPLAVQAPHFPLSVLQLPFVHILSQLPHHERQLPSQSYSDTAKAEPALRFGKILEAMKPPICWGMEASESSSDVQETPQLKSIITSPMTFLDKNNGTKNDPYNTSRFLIGLLSLQSLLSDNSPTSRMLKHSLNELVSTFARNTALHDLQKGDSRKKHIKSLNRTWVVVKVSLKRNEIIGEHTN